MLELEAKQQTKISSWVTATWDEFAKITADPAYAKARCYYNNGQMRIETMPVGADHASDNGIIHFAIGLFCTLRGIPHKGLINCSYRKNGIREFQPDISYYLNENLQSAPFGSSVVNLDRTPVPDLVIEISHTTLADDKEAKLLLYQDVSVPEYWLVNVEKMEILAFKIADRDREKITQSQVLSGLEISILEQALQRSRQSDQSKTGAWLLSQFQ
ncbi:Uma2 family endonuclease [Tumidithrix helvetica PCC 7403]|uniref:Uma2 family endonuclease n=1 Tax=Tumidithrix helvetica TaxID=3457545 RepID=UPI003CBADBDB